MAEAVTFAGPAVGVNPSREAIARAPSHPCGQLRLLGGNRPSARRARRLPWHLTRAIPGHACPAFVPRTTGRRQETTGTAGVSNPQVRNRIRASPQVARSAPRTLSRWRHGFEPRWDYQVRACIGESRLPVAPHWPRGVHGAVTDQNSVSSGERSDRVRPFKPFLARREGGAEGGLSRTSSLLHSRHDDA